MRTMKQTESRRNVVHGHFERNFLVRVIHRLMAWNRRRLAIRELRTLPDYLLRDLGIERYEIRSAVLHGGSLERLRPAKADSAVAPLKKAAA